MNIMGRKRIFSQEDAGGGSEKLSPVPKQSKLEDFFAPLKRQNNNECLECLEASPGEIGRSLWHSPAPLEEIGGDGISNPTG